MTALLDTHVLLWWLADRERLSADQQRLLDSGDADTPLLVSDISLWEIAMLHSLGRIRLTIPLREWLEKGVYPGFPTIFSGLLGFFVGDFMGKALWQLVENAQRFPRRGGRVLCVHGAVSFHGARPWATRWLPGRGARRDVELDRCVLGLRSGRCSHQNRRPVQAERSIYPGKTEISGTYALWETRI